MATEVDTHLIEQISPANGASKRRKMGFVDYERLQHEDARKFLFLNDEICWLRGKECADSRAAQRSNGVAHPSHHPKAASGMAADDVHYSQAWFAHYKRRESKMKPWSICLCSYSSSWEVHRLSAIKDFWATHKSHRINPVTIHLAIWILNRLLSQYSNPETLIRTEPIRCDGSRTALPGVLGFPLSRNAGSGASFAPRTGDFGKSLTAELFAGIVAVSIRTALKFEERPEALWGVRRIWEVLPCLESWNVDRSDQFLMKVEAEALQILDDCFDVPLSVQFFNKYIIVGGWPHELVKEYTALGHFLLSLATFASEDNFALVNVSPSKLAAAAVVLSVKIVNGDTKRSYEFYPERFAAFSQIPFKELQPVIKGLSNLLRNKPQDANVLGAVYPGWGQHEWQ